LKILIPVDDKNQEKSNVSIHFGHCFGFYLYDSDRDTLKFVKNDFPHSDPKKTFVDYTMDLRPNTVFSLGMGQKAIDLFKNYEVEILTGNFKNISGIMKNIENLRSLDKNCGH